MISDNKTPESDNQRNETRAARAHEAAERGEYGDGIVLNLEPAAPAQAQHSTLPWKIGEGGDIYSGKALVAKVYSKYGGTQDGNAALIVRACNNAQRLADALQKYHDMMPTPESSEALAEWSKSI